MPNVALTTPADIAAAAPAWLGFVPTNSIVAYMLYRDITHGFIVRSAIRFDVTITTSQAANFPATCNLHVDRHDATILLAVCDSHQDPHAHAILNTLRDALQQAGIPVLRRIMTHDLTVAGYWFDPDSGESGPTYAYTDSLWTAHRVHAGQPVSPSRADIQAEFARIEPAPPTAVGDHGELVTTTAQDIADVLAGAPITHRNLATRAGIIITNHTALRDAMIGLAIDRARPAAELWTHIARQLRGQPRAEALTIAAVCYCFLGDSIRAAIATDAAIDEADATETPVPALAAMLLSALRAGVPPAQIAGAITTAIDPKHHQQD